VDGGQSGSAAQGEYHFGVFSELSLLHSSLDLSLQLKVPVAWVPLTVQNSTVQYFRSVVLHHSGTIH